MFTSASYGNLPAMCGWLFYSFSTDLAFCGLSTIRGHQRHFSSGQTMWSYSINIWHLSVFYPPPSLSLSFYCLYSCTSFELTSMDIMQWMQLHVDLQVKHKSLHTNLSLYNLMFFYVHSSKQTQILLYVLKYLKLCLYLA